MALSKKKKFAVAGAAVVLVAGAGGAYAYWTTSGSGGGTASTGTVTNGWGVSVSSNSAKLYPGSAANTYTVTITNNGSGAQQVQTASVVIDAPTTVAANQDSSKPACTAADYSASAVSGYNHTTSIASGGTTSGTFTVKMENREDGATPGSGNQDNCKGATANFHVDVN